MNTLTGQATVVGPLVNGNQHSALAIASGAPCVPPTEVPWLSLSPSSGSMVPGKNDEVTVTMNASQLTVGTHQANVCVGSNDPLRPLVGVPLSLTVTGPLIRRRSCRESCTARCPSTSLCHPPVIPASNAAAAERPMITS